MARRSGTGNDRDRHLVMRSGVYHYKRRIPASVRRVDDRGEHVRKSLKTDDLAKARALRDILEAADDELWASLLGDVPRDAAHASYRLAVKRATALGFTYRLAANMPATETLDGLARRLEAILGSAAPAAVAPGLLGLVDRPEVPISKAWELYRDEIAPHAVAGKSAGQRKRWTLTKKTSVDAFIEVTGDLPMPAIDRDAARKFYDHFMRRLAPSEGPATASASLGNRRLGDLRGLYRDYFNHIGEHDRPNPFDKLTYREPRKRRKRPSIALDWILSTILAPGALAGLNAEARGIVLMVAAIGARPSEICNLVADQIVLAHRVPHIRIEPREDAGDRREIKTESSIRVVPLIGLALDVMTAHPSGFPRYRDKEDSLSGALNKYFKENGLFPSDRHTVYSFRHGFEDRMKEAHVDTELRKILMGHTIDRPTYGEGGSLDLRAAEMLKVALPTVPGLV